MNKTVTAGKRFLENDVWHDDRGEIPGSPADWDPPMTEVEGHEAALSDPDGQPISPEQLAGFRRIPRATFIRRKLGLTREQFAERFRIPVETLQDWERHRAEPDAAMLAYLLVIEREPETVVRVLETA